MKKKTKNSLVFLATTAVIYGAIKIAAAISKKKKVDIEIKDAEEEHLGI